MESDLVDFSSGSTDSAINFSGSADLHTPIHPLLNITKVIMMKQRDVGLQTNDKTGSGRKPDFTS